MNNQTVGGELAPLRNYLSKQTELHVTLSFGQIELILSEPLPYAAYKYHIWWINSHIPNAPATSWLDAEYEVASITLGDWVEFRKRGDISSASFS